MGGLWCILHGCRDSLCAARMLSRAARMLSRAARGVCARCAARARAQISYPLSRLWKRNTLLRRACVGAFDGAFVAAFDGNIVTSVHMVARTRRCYEQHARGNMHPYRRLSKKTYAILEQQRTCTAVAHMRALIKQGKQLFYSVALMHVCQISNGNALCAMCADGDAYGNRRPQNESPDSFPLFSRVPNVPDMTSEHEALLKAKLHPYRRLCKLAYLIFEKQEECKTLTKMRRLAIDAMDLFDNGEEPQMDTCQTEMCGTSCISCMERVAYGSIRPRGDI